MKTCQETEVQLQVILRLNDLAFEAAEKNLTEEARRIRVCIGAVAQIRLDRCKIREGEFWSRLEKEMKELTVLLHPRLNFDSLDFLNGQRNVAKKVRLPFWVFNLLVPLEYFWTDYNGVLYSSAD